MLRRNTLANAARIVGERATIAQRQAVARAVVGSFYDFVADVGQSVGLSREQLLARIADVEGDERYQTARQERKGAIIVTAHMGSFEVAAAALLQHEKSIHVLFRRDARGLFEKTRAALRKRLGIMETCVDDGLTSWVRLKEALAGDEVVLVQGDRVMPDQKGERVRFLGGHLLVPLGPIKLALVSGAPIVPVFSTRLEDGRVRLSIAKPIRVHREEDVGPALRELAAVIETYVRLYPEQWLMVHRAFCEDAEG